MIELARAHATLVRGARFLRSGLRTMSVGGPQPLPLAIEGPYRAKVIGNALRELDRFLVVLIEAGTRRAALPRPVRRGTAETLRAWPGMRLREADHRRLRALRRSRDCLFHCGGVVRRGDGRGDGMLTAGWADPGTADLRRFALGQTLVVTAADLADIGTFYESLAADLLRAVLAAGPHLAGETGRARGELMLHDDRPVIQGVIVGWAP